MNNVKIGKKKKKWILYVLMGFFATCAVGFSIGLGLEMHTNMQARSYYENLAADIERRPGTPGSPVVAQLQENTVREAEPGDGLPVAEESEWTPFMDFDALAGRFPGIVGWIILEGTKIDYPIMQWTNNHHFLGTLPDGTSHRNGSIFLDYRNSPDFTDRSIVIYGHESRTEDMFGALKNFRRQEFFEAHPVMYIFTPDRDYKLMLFAGYLVDAGVETPPLRFDDDSDFEGHIADIKRRSLFRSDVEVTVDDKIVSLATCAYDFVNARFVIVGTLVEY